MRSQYIKNPTLKIYMVRYTCIMISEVFFVNTILNVSFKKKQTEKNLKEPIKQNLNKKAGIFMLVIGIIKNNTLHLML